MLDRGFLSQERPGSRPLNRLTKALILAALLPLFGCNRPTRQDVPAGYPSAYADLIDAAKGESRLLIWSAIDAQKAQALIAGFRRRYPSVRVDYVEMSAGQVYTRYLAAIAARRPAADLLWSSAMDLQIKLANDGYAQQYASPEAVHLPGWANWKNQAWGTTAEPIVMVYNKKLIASAAMPGGHAALTNLLERTPGALRGKIATYDLDQSAVGYLYLTQDQEATPNLWRLVRAMGKNGVRLFPTAEGIMADVAAGRSAIGYNIVGSYALEQTEHNPNLGMLVPRDYALLMSRLAVIPVTAPHPAAAKLFLDYLLSAEGQSSLAKARMPSVRSDVPSPAALRPADLRPRAIRVGPALLIGQDQLTHRYILRKWHKAIYGDATPRDHRPD